MSKSQKPSTIALSSTEAELDGGVSATKQIIWLRNQLEFLGHPQSEPTVLFADNTSMITLASNYSGHTKRMRHCLQKVHFMMEQVHNSVIRLAYLKTEDHTADILTKPLPPSSHWHHMEPLLGENPAIAAIMEDVAHIKGRAVCLHVDVRRVPKSLTFHVDVSGGGEAGAPGGKAREMAGEQLAVEQAQAQIRKEDSFRAEAGGQKREQLDQGKKAESFVGTPDEQTRSPNDRKFKKRKHGKDRKKLCKFARGNKTCSEPNCPHWHG